MRRPDVFEELRKVSVKSGKAEGWNDEIFP